MTVTIMSKSGQVSSGITLPLKKKSYFFMTRLKEVSRGQNIILITLCQGPTLPARPILVKVNLDQMSEEGFCQISLLES